jgi:hypothetical protein
MILEPDEVICNRCDGSGEEPGEFVGGFEITCSRCWGTGKLDWIENIMGKISRLPLFGDPDGPVELFFEGNKLFETTKDGINFH